MEIVRPTTEYRQSWLESYREWGTLDQPGTSLVLASAYGLDVLDEGDFAIWVQLLNDFSRQDFDRLEGFVPSTERWLVDGPTYLGAVSLRQDLSTDLLREFGGHIGYGVRPSARKKGHASRMMQWALEEAARIGLKRVLVTCEDANVGSARVIEKHGGELERIVDCDGRQMRRYWVTV